MAEIKDSPEQMTHSDVAARLRAAREKAGFSRPDVAMRTKIPERHLISLEAGDFNAVGGRAYAIGFTRSYARAVGLDEAEITTELRAELGASEIDDDRRQTAKFEPGDPSRIPGRGTAWVAALGALAVVIAGFTLWRSNSEPPVALPSLTAEAPPPAATQEAQPANPAQPSVQGPVVFTAIEEGVWVKFYDAQGNQLMQKLMAKGEAYTVPAEAQGPLIWTARPDALQVSVAGRVLAPLADRQVTVKDVPVSAAALLARNPQPAAGPSSGLPSAPPGVGPQARGGDASRVVTAAQRPALAAQTSTDSR
jgi:transcriptional regulator with XRE-family HTH domain